MCGTKLPGTPGDMLAGIPGTPGEDYPTMDRVLPSSFSCRGLQYGGYYADKELQCQVYHVCVKVSVCVC